MTERPAGTNENAILRVTEIFYSIQGESTWAGLPCAFVRLTGCSLRCTWCDTRYSFSGGENRSIAEILDVVRGYGAHLAEITGGEPLLQANCSVLAQALCDEGYTVLIETSGAVSLEGFPEAVHWIMDLKCPDSGMSERMRWENVDLLRPERDEIKFVIASRGDYEWSRSALEEYSLAQRCKSVLFAPVFGRVDPADLAAWIMEDRLPVRLQLQLHKLIWDPERRGV